MEVDSQREIFTLVKKYQSVHIPSKVQILQNESSSKQSFRGKN